LADYSYLQNSFPSGHLVGHPYDNPGVYYALHQIGDPNIPQFQHSVIGPIYIYPEPIADFILSKDSVCENENLSIIYNAINPDNNVPGITTPQVIDSSGWTITDPHGNITNYPNWGSNNINIILDTSGIWYFQLTVKSNSGCYSTKIDSVQVFTLPQANFTIIPDSTCLGTNPIFDGSFSSSNPSISGNSGPIVYWNWNFNSTPINNQTNGGPISQTFYSSGSKNISLLVVDQLGCEDSISKQLIIEDSLVVDFDFNKVCDGYATNFNAYYPLTSNNVNKWEWDFFNNSIVEDSINSNLNYFLPPGLHAVKLTVYDTTIFPDGCPTSIIKNVRVFSNPTANFNASTECINNYTKIEDISIVGDTGLYTNRIWKYKDLSSISQYIPLGFSSILDSIEFDYCGKNRYEIRLTVIDSNQCIDSIDKKVTVACLPTANIEWNTVCNNNITTFKDSSIQGTFPLGPYATYAWTNSNGIWPTLDSISDEVYYQFYNWGSQNNTTLTITDSLGCMSTAVVNAYVYQNPVVNILQIDPVCFGDISTFNSNTSNQNIQSWSWDFGNNEYSSSEDTMFLYNSEGTYQVTLEIRDNNNCYGYDTSIATVNYLPVAKINYDIVCLGNNTPINAFSSTPNVLSINASLTDTLWDFGNNGNINDLGSTTSIGLNNCGDSIEQIKLTVIDNQLPSCSNTEVIYINVACNPTAIITSDTVCEGDATELSSISSRDGGTSTIDSILWSLNGLGQYSINSDSNLAVTNFIFNQINCQQIQTAILKVTTEEGCSDICDTNIYVRCNPIADFNTGLNSTCANTNFTIFNNSQPQGYLDSIHWDFGPFSTPTFVNNIENPNIVYSLGGYYDITMYYQEDFFGSKCWDTIVKTIHIDSLPYANFTWQDSVCANDIIIFENLSQSTSNNISNNGYFWNFFGSNIPSNQINPTYQYSDINLYTGGTRYVELTVTDVEGCKNSIIDSLDIHPIPFMNITTNNRCDNDTNGFSFNNFSSVNPIFGDSILLNQWIFNGNYWYMKNWQTTDYNNLPINESPGYNLNLGITTTYGCYNDTNTSIFVYESPQIDFTTSFRNDPQPRCGNNLIMDFVTNSLAGGWNYFEFEIEDDYNYDIINQDTVFSHIYPEPGNWPLNIKITNNRCAFDSTIIIQTYPLPTALFEISDTIGCEPLVVEFSDLSLIELPINYTGDSTFLESWLWNFGDGEQSSIQNPTYPYNAYSDNDTNYIAQLTIFTNYGCKDSIASIPIRVNPTPIAKIYPRNPTNISFGKYIFNGTKSTTSMNIPASTDYFDYYWYVEDGINYDTIPQNSIYPQEDSTYYQYQSLSDPEGKNYEVILIVTDGLCSSRDSITHFVKYYSGLQIPNSFAPNSSGNQSAIFMPKGKSLVKYYIRVFDKFGGLVWESNKLDNTGKPIEFWDGTSNGIAMPQGTYIWKILEAEFADGYQWEGINGNKTGSIYLIR
tara:strand:- start:3388 stop:7749 length:4362 start_codon:yes stop_codon:yes gene_type:complete